MFHCRSLPQNTLSQGTVSLKMVAIFRFCLLLTLSIKVSLPFLWTCQQRMITCLLDDLRVSASMWFPSATLLCLIIFLNEPHTHNYMHTAIHSFVIHLWSGHAYFPFQTFLSYHVWLVNHNNLLPVFPPSVSPSSEFTSSLLIAFFLFALRVPHIYCIRRRRA